MPSQKSLSTHTCPIRDLERELQERPVDLPLRLGDLGAIWRGLGYLGDLESAQQHKRAPSPLPFPAFASAPYPPPAAHLNTCILAFSEVPSRHYFRPQVLPTSFWMVTE
eukprot:Sspe_Gene.80682::Locus_51058_Transcript_1_1_Confidence_1.000_Length_1574::g.80682::m.80682